MKDLALKIRRLRELQNYSQEYVADCLGISRRTYGKIESGQIRLTVERLQLIAQIFGCPLDAILLKPAEEVFMRHLYCSNTAN